MSELDYYSNKRKIPGRGICGLARMAFTVGLFYGLIDSDWDGCEGRYCFHTMAEAKEALEKWDGVGDPSGNWVKHKGHKEYSNPNYDKTQRVYGD